MAWNPRWQSSRPGVDAKLFFTSRHPEPAIDGVHSECVCHRPSITSFEDENVTPKLIGWLLLVLGFAFVGCQHGREFPSTYSVYQVVLADLLLTVECQGNFNGTQIAVSPSQCDGTTNGFGTSITVDKVLMSDLERANNEKHEFEPTVLALSNVRIEEIPAFDGMYYHRAGNQPRNLKCLVQFWHAGFSKDGITAVVKFLYGPSSHGAIGTYVLRRTTNRWRIAKKVIDYYM